MITLRHVIEALLFASQKPLAPREIAAALRSAAADSEDETIRAVGKTKEAEVAAALEELKIGYIQAGHAFQLVEKASGWRLVSDPAAGPWVRQLYPEARPARLSGPALETLAIVAYRQPITKADIEAVRGVAVDGMMQSLLERQLVKIGGRAEVPGRPLLYETTEFFLEHFGLRTVDELPNSNELRRVALPTAEPPPAETPAPESAAAEALDAPQSETPAPEPPEPETPPTE